MFSSLSSSEFVSCKGRKLKEIFGTKITKLVLLPMRPQVFNRVQLWSVRGQSFQLDPSIQGINELSYQPASMSHETVPNNKKFTLDLLVKMFKKVNDLFGSDGAWVKLKIKPPHAHSRYSRKLFPVKTHLKHRCLPHRSPCTHSVRSFRQTAFINEHYCLPFLSGVFFKRGHRFVFQFLIAFSSRCIAWVVGFCDEKPIADRNLQTPLSV